MIQLNKKKKIINDNLKKEIFFQMNKILLFLCENRVPLLFSIIYLIFSVLVLVTKSKLLFILQSLIFLFNILYIFPFSFYTYYKKSKKKEKKNKEIAKILDFKKVLKFFVTYLIDFTIIALPFFIIFILSIFIYFNLFLNGINTYSVEELSKALVFQPFLYLIAIIFAFISAFLIIFLPYLIVRNIEKTFSETLFNSLKEAIKQLLNFKTWLLLASFILFMQLATSLPNSVLLIIFNLIFFGVFSFLLFYSYYYNLEKEIEIEVNKFLIVKLITSLLLIIFITLSNIESTTKILLMAIIVLTLPFYYLPYFSFILALYYLIF